jgi:hypothetical protein
MPISLGFIHTFMKKLWFYKLNYNYLDPGSTHKLNLESGSRSGSSTIFSFGSSSNLTNPDWNQWLAVG